MNERQLKRLISQVKSGAITAQDAVNRLKLLPFQDLGFAKLDTHRQLRTGFPEVVLCEGKTPEQVVAILKKLTQRHPVTLATRATPQLYQAIAEALPQAQYRQDARLIVIRKGRPPTRRKGPILVISAGTADLPVAEEAAATAEELGNRVERIYDVGVAGIHRLLKYREQLLAAKVIIVVAGMEGALASVVGGLVEAPVIAVPTSVGYGASFQGLAALLGMLNTCAAGVVVVNIDNGFGAGYFASLIVSRSGK